MARLLKHFFRPKEQGLRCSAVIPAAGLSRRMGEDKILMPLGGIPTLVHTLRAIAACPLVEEIIVVTEEKKIVPVSQLCQDFAINKVRKVVRGGETRAESVFLGVSEVNAEADVIAVHDGARPLVTPELVERVIRAAQEHGAAAPALPVKDTVKRAQDGLVLGTPERSELFAVQTPQAFDAALIKAALKQAITERASITDDCSAIERLGMSVYLVEGEETNMKLTTSIDVFWAEGLLEWRDTQ